MTQSSERLELRELLVRQMARYVREASYPNVGWWRTSETALAQHRFSRLAHGAGMSAVFNEAIYVGGSNVLGTFGAAQVEPGVSRFRLGEAMEAAWDDELPALPALTSRPSRPRLLTLVPSI